MTTLKIPQLNLFNPSKNRKSSHVNHISHKSHTSIQHNAEVLLRSHRTEKQHLNNNRSRQKQFFKNKNILTSPSSIPYDYSSTLNYGYYEPTMLSATLPYHNQNMYKQIADNYLNYKPMMLGNMVDSAGYYNNNISPYKYKAMRDYQRTISSGSPRKFKYNNKCECQDHQLNNNSIKHLHNNNKNNINHINNQIRIEKDPYLVPTFRQHVQKSNININTNNNMSNNMSNNMNNNNSANNSFIDNLNKIQNRDQIRQVSNYFVNSNRSNVNNINNNKNNYNSIQRLKTNQSGQQDNNNNHNNNNNNNNNNDNIISLKNTKKQTLSSTSMQTQPKQPQPIYQKRRRDPILIQKILQQQQFALQNLCLSFDQDQHNYEICFNDLQMTKGNYLSYNLQFLDIIMQKSKDILVKLNQCADEKRVVMRNPNSNIRMGNVFSMLNVE